MIALCNDVDQRSPHIRASFASLCRLGHLNTCTGKTELDVERRIQLSNQGFWRTYHVWKNRDIDPELKTEMFRRFVAKLVYAGAATWTLSDDICRKLNNWAGEKMAVIWNTTHKEENATDPKPAEKQLLRSAVGHGFGRDKGGRGEGSRGGGKS